MGLDDPARTYRLSGEAAVIFAGLQDTWGMTHALVLLAQAAAVQADPERAALLLGAADSLVERTGAVIYFVDELAVQRTEAAINDQIGLDVFGALRRRGRALPADDLAALVRAEQVPGR